jgi:hypothetical protein
MKYDEITPTMRRWLGGREAFRKMGFSADDLYCTTARSARFNGRLSAFVELQAQGKTFLLECGEIESEQAFADEYQRVCAAANSGELSQDDADRIWRESEPYQDKLGFTLAVVGKGFVPPYSLS